MNKNTTKTNEFANANAVHLASLHTRLDALYAEFWKTLVPVNLAAMETLSADIKVIQAEIAALKCKGIWFN
jgi:hypothetical protein